MGRPVALVDAYPHTVGGSTLVLLGLAARARERGWEPTLHLLGPGSAAAEAARAAGVPVVPHALFGPLVRYGRAGQRTIAGRAATVASLPIIWGSLAAALRSAGLAHIDDHRAMVLAGPPARALRLPVVWHVHATPAGPRLDRACALLASRIVVPAAVVAGRLRAAGHRGPVDVIPNDLPARRFAACRAAPWTGPAPGAPPTLVAVGRLHPDKGHDLAIEALALLRAAGHPTARLLLVGGPQPGADGWPAHLDALARRLGVAGAVERLGHVDDPTAVVARASVLVQPARDATELQPLAVLEAMAQGAPVVVTDVGGLAELVGAAGVVAGPGAQGLAAAVAGVLDEPVRAAALGRAAALAVEGRGATAGADRTIDVWDELARRRPARVRRAAP